MRLSRSMGRSVPTPGVRWCVQLSGKMESSLRHLLHGYLGGYPSVPQFSLLQNSQILHSQASSGHWEVMHMKAWGKSTGPSLCPLQIAGLFTLSFRVLLSKAVTKRAWWTDSQEPRELLTNLWLVLVKHKTAVNFSCPEPNLPSRDDRGKNMGFCTASQRAVSRETSHQDTQFCFRVCSTLFWWPPRCQDFMAPVCPRHPGLTSSRRTWCPAPRFHLLDSPKPAWRRMENI